MLDNLGLIPLIPFIGFLFNGIFGRRAGKPFVSLVGVGTSVLSAVLTTKAALEYAAHYHHGERHLDIAEALGGASDRLERGFTGCRLIGLPRLSQADGCGEAKASECKQGPGCVKHASPLQKDFYAG